MQNLKVAICLRGAIAKITGTFFTENSLYRTGQYINYNACYNSIIKHIINPNLNQCSFDFFIHCWNIDLEKDLIKLYNPKKYLFEDNTPYNQEISAKVKVPNDFSGVSHSLSIKKSIELMKEYEQENNIKYNLVILFRPDLIILKDMLLKEYKLDKVYVNGNHLGDPDGDFHFIMNSEMAGQFKNLYHSIENGNPCKAHFWMKNYINNYMKQELLKDNIIAGSDEEVLRKINVISIKNHKISIEKLLEYGLTRKEIENYNIP